MLQHSSQNKMAERQYINDDDIVTDDIPKRHVHTIAAREYQQPVYQKPMTIANSPRVDACVALASFLDSEDAKASMELNVINYAMYLDLFKQFVNVSNYEVIGLLITFLKTFKPFEFVPMLTVLLHSRARLSESPLASFGAMILYFVLSIIHGKALLLLFYLVVNFGAVVANVITTDL